MKNSKVLQEALEVSDAIENFKQNKKVCMSNRVGYAARMETRKSPHFLEGIDSYAFTDIDDWKWWKERAGFKFDK